MYIVSADETQSVAFVPASQIYASEDIGDSQNSSSEGSQRFEEEKKGHVCGREKKKLSGKVNQTQQEVAGRTKRKTKSGGSEEN